MGLLKWFEMIAAAEYVYIKLLAEPLKIFTK